MQKEFGILEFPKDFYASYKTPISTKAIIFMMSVVSLQLTISSFIQVKAEIVRKFSDTLTTISVLGIISITIHFLLALSILVASTFWVQSEITFRTNIKRKMRTYSWKTFGFILPPLVITYWILGISEGVIYGWDNLPSSSSYKSIAIIGSLVTCFIVAAIIKNPTLYLKKKLSYLFHGGIIFAGIVYILEYLIEGSTNFLAPYLVIGPILMVFRELRGGKTTLQQIAESIYTLPDFINSIVAIDQRRIALAIGLMKFSEFTQLEKEELFKHLIAENKNKSSSENLWTVLWKGVKFVVISIILYFVTEGPASYLFDKFVEWVESQ